MEVTAASIRSQIESISRGPARRYPEPLRSAIVSFVRVQREAGVTWHRIEGDLGICSRTLRDWCREATPGTMVPVEVLAAQPDAADGRAGALCLITPRGLRLEGLSPAAAVHLIRELG